MLNGTVLEDGDASFVATGRFTSEGWISRSESFSLTIGHDGGVVGQGTFQGQPIAVEGTFADDDLELLIELRVPELTAGGFPAGTRFQFLYELRHFPRAAGEGGAESNGGAGGCREVVYRLKLVPNLFGSGLSSVRVPECVN